MLQNQLKHKTYLQNKDFLLGLNFQSFRCHHDELIVELETYFHKLKIIALTETWLTKSEAEHLKTTGEKL